ncbi:NUDIX hydrolase [Streptomyces sp. NPDC097619]|uniref:NUDIX hydrolase n=1 Tax=Streptomyces sp. NPDC097619 TaxID=3157228 RepID=UPI0033184D03
MTGDDPDRPGDLPDRPAGTHPASRTGAGGPGGPRPLVAAGCVLWRRSPRDGGIEVCLVHRPRYDDWSHPKGKVKKRETAAAAAVREVLEETGQRCAPGAALPTVRYPVGGLPKTVHYWTAEALGGTFTPSDEVDEIRWSAPAAAAALLTHPHDRELLARALPLLPHP